MRARPSTRIAKVTLGASATEIDFTSIPQSYTHLFVVGSLRTDRAATTVDQVLVRVGSGSLDTAANYRWHGQTFRGGTTDLDVSDADDDWIGQDSNTNVMAAAATAPAGYFLPVEVMFHDYTVAANQKAMTYKTMYDVGSGSGMTFLTGIWENTTDTINTIRFAPGTGTNFVAGSTLTLYGMP